MSYDEYPSEHPKRNAVILGGLITMMILVAAFGGQAIAEKSASNDTTQESTPSGQG